MHMHSARAMHVQLGCIVKEVFLLDQRELMKLCGADT